MPTLDDIYHKFGFASEAAQLLETQLGNMLFAASAIEGGLLAAPDVARAEDLISSVNRHTLGQLLKSLRKSHEPIDNLEALLTRALAERNRLVHSFYREHNFRKNSEEGRALMMIDLECIHDVLLEAYTAVLRLSGVDLADSEGCDIPTRHLPI